MPTVARIRLIKQAHTLSLFSVPVIPDFLADEADRLSNGTQTEAGRIEFQGSVGILFASKSILQLIFNPLAGYLAYK